VLLNFTEALHGAMQVEQTRLLYARLPLAIVINVLLALILITMQSHVIGTVKLASWLAILAVALAYRTALAFAWQRSGAQFDGCPPAWLRRFRFGVIATGLAWGLASILLFPANDTLHQVTLSFVVAGICAGAITSLAADRISIYGFLLPALLPLIVRFGLESGEHASAMGLMTALFLIAIAMNAAYAGRSLIDNIRLRINASKQEQVLRDSEARLKQAQQSAHVGNWEMDLVNNKLYWSDEIFRIFEIDQNRVTPSYDGFLKATHPDDREMVNKAYTDSLASRTPYDLVHRLLFANGRIKYVRELCETYFDPDGKPLRSLGTVQDITQQQLAENSLRESEARFRAVTYNANDAIVTADSSERIIGWNRGAETIFGYTEDEILGESLTVLMPQQYRAQHLAGVARMIAGGKPRISSSGPIELAGLRKDGSVFPLEISLGHWRNKDGMFFTGVVRDITERKKDELALRESEARFRFMLENSPIAACITRTPDCQIIFANQRYAAMLNTSPEKVASLNPKHYYVSPQHYSEVLEQLDKGEQVTNRLVELSVPNVYSKTTWALASYLKLEYENKPAVLGWFYDISDRKAMEEQVLYLAHHDALTGLPNRTLLYDRLQHALSIAKRDHVKLALMFIDLDKFKPINDMLGHDIGDLVLKEVAHRIQDCLRESDTVARLGGDEFVALLSTVNTPYDALQVAETIRFLLNQPFELAGHVMNISSSTGIAIYPEHGVSEKQLIKNADAAMYYAKSIGRNNVQIYRTDLPDENT